MLFRPSGIIALISLSVYTLSCTAEAATDKQPSAINPNGDSELALHMRAMYDDAAQMKEAIARGERPESSLDHARMLTASATQPEKVASDTYKTWAESYLHTVEALKNGDLEMAPDLFDNMVGNCMGCHTDLCPGPKVRIKNLY
jgi:mono/diheme cytochrome c family protein